VCSRVGETERLVCTRSCNALAVEVPHPLQGAIVSYPEIAWHLVSGGNLGMASYESRDWPEQSARMCQSIIETPANRQDGGHSGAPV
jgi:hypothetical protein